MTINLGFKTTEMYSLMVLEARIQHQNNSKTEFPPVAFGEICYLPLQFLVATGIRSFLDLWPHHSSLCLFLLMAFASASLL